MPDISELTVAIELYAKRKLPYDRMRIQIQAQRDQVAAAIAPLLAKVTKNGPRMMMLAQVLGTAGAPETTGLLLDAIERFKDELYVRYLETQMGNSDNRPASAWQPLRQRAIGLLRHQTPCVRVAACHMVRALPGPDAVEPLLACLSDQDRSVRIAAIHAVAAQGDPRIIPPLEAIAGGQDGYAANIAYTAIITLSGDRRVEFLRWGLRHPDREMWDAAAIALWRRPEPALVDDLRDALRRHLTAKADSVGSQLIRALGKTGDARVAEDLLRLFSDADPYYREPLCVALGDLRTRAAVPLLLPLLHDDGDSNLRYSVAEALGRVGDPATVPALLAAPPSYATHGALAAIGGDQVMVAIDDRLREASTGEGAIDILTHMKEPAALERLTTLLRHPHLALHAARALLVHTHPTAWQAALPMAGRAPVSWREITDNFICASCTDQIGLARVAERRKALAVIPASTTPEPVDPGSASSFLPGTWSVIGDATTQHVFTPDEKWFAFDGAGEVIIEGAWNDSHDGTKDSASLWSGYSYPTLKRQDQDVVIDDPDDSPTRLRRISDATDIPPKPTKQTRKPSARRRRP